MASQGVPNTMEETIMINSSAKNKLIEMHLTAMADAFVLQENNLL